MSVPGSGLNPPGSRYPSANDRFKAGWSRRRAWSTLTAVAVHVVVILLWPDLTVSDRLLDAYGYGLRLDGIPLLPAVAQSGGMPGPAAAQYVVATDAATDSDLAPAEDPATSAATAERLAGAQPGAAEEGIRARLRTAGRLRPTIVEPLDEPAPREPVATEQVAARDETNLRIGGSASDPDFEPIRGADGLDLNRLASIKPELALFSPSSWILVQNPSDVVAFLSRKLRREALDPVSSGMVSVALWVDERGSVEWAEINQSSGRRDVDEAALQLFHEVVSFRPARERGVPVPIAMVIHLTYPW